MRSGSPIARMISEVVRPSQAAVPSTAETRRDDPQAVSKARADKRRMKCFMAGIKTKNVQNRGVLHINLRGRGPYTSVAVANSFRKRMSFSK